MKPKLYPTQLIVATASAFQILFHKSSMSVGVCRRKWVWKHTHIHAHTLGWCACTGSVFVINQILRFCCFRCQLKHWIDCIFKNCNQFMYCKFFRATRKKNRIFPNAFNFFDSKIERKKPCKNEKITRKSPIEIDFDEFPVMSRAHQNSCLFPFDFEISHVVCVCRRLENRTQTRNPPLPC